jgi:L-lactate dehydrogenase
VGYRRSRGRELSRERSLIDYPAASAISEEKSMKVGIVGAGAVGTACLFAMALRGSAPEIVLVNRNYERARGAVTDLRMEASSRRPFCCGPANTMTCAAPRDGRDHRRRQRKKRRRHRPQRSRRPPAAARRQCRDLSRRCFQDCRCGSEALLLVVTDPPDPLADLARRIAVTTAW